MLSKHIEMGSCFEDLFETDIIVQSEFEFDEWFKNYYSFLNFKTACMCYWARGFRLSCNY